jgi:RNA polymerase sigma-70 factor (ECF subfamily)
VTADSATQSKRGAEPQRRVDPQPDCEETRSAEELRDALSTQLMEHYRLSQGRGERGPEAGGRGRLCFGLLYELNAEHLLIQVASRLRRYQSRSDPRDVLQEVFFNVYRYPHRFDAARDDAFRVWSATIVRNTVLKHLRSLGRNGRVEVPVEDLSEHPEARSAEPQAGAIERESRGECARVYLTYLHLYLRFYSMLSERERLAIHLVEVDQTSYRDAARELGIKLENLKMVIFRARRKIHRSMRRVFDGLSPDCRPARAGADSGLDLGEPASVLVASGVAAAQAAHMAGNVAGNVAGPAAAQVAGDAMQTKDSRRANYGQGAGSGEQNETVRSRTDRNTTGKLKPDSSAAAADDCFEDGAS